MGAAGLGQTVVAKRFDGVAGSRERFQKADPEGRADGQAIQPVQQALNLGAVKEIAAGHAAAQNLLAELPHGRPRCRMIPFTPSGT